MTPSPAEPERYGNYEVLQHPDGSPVELGRGGFGRTLRAQHRFLGTEVALKVIADRLAFDGTARARFLQEAREHARLEHPGIARIIEFGEKDGTFFYSMDLCPDGDLKDYVKKRGALDAAEALKLILQTAEALRYVHECGILHLDIKPSNLLVILPAQGPPRVKITDFGLVKRMAGSGEISEAPDAVASWSPAFASPEQIRERELDERTDLFSLGMTAWFLLTGGAAPEGDLSRIIRERLSDEPYEPRLPAGLTGELRRIVARMVEKDAGRRYRSCAELVPELQAALGMATAAPVEGLRRLKDRFRLEPAGRNFTGEVFRGAELRSGASVRVTVVHPGHAEAMVADLRARAARLLAEKPAGLVLPAEVAEYAEGWVVVEEETRGLPLPAVLRDVGALPFRTATGLLRGAAAAIDAATACGFLPAPLETAQMEGVTAEGRVDWPEVRVRFGLQWMTPPPDWTSGAEVTTLTAPDSPQKLFAAMIYQVLSARQVRSAALHSSAACPPIPGLGSDGNRILAACLAGEAEYPDCTGALAALIASESLSSSRPEKRAGMETTKPARPSPAETAPRLTDTAPPLPAAAVEEPVHVLTPAVTAPATRRPPAWLQVIIGAAAAAAAVGGVLLIRQGGREAPAAAPGAPGIAATAPELLPATIAVRSFQSRVPLPSGLTIAGRTGRREGNSLVFERAAAADGSCRPDSPRWQFAGRPVAVGEQLFEVKIRFVTLPVSLTVPPGAVPPWTELTITPEESGDLPEAAKLAALTGAVPAGSAWQFRLTFPDPPPLTLPPGTCRLVWSGAGKSRDGGLITVPAEGPFAITVPVPE